LELNQSLNKKFLLIDDFSNVRKSVKAMLNSLGVSHVSEASNGTEATKSVRDQTFDVILCDYNLGKSKNGSQLLEEWRTRGWLSYQTVFVMITAETSRDFVMGALEFQPDDYLAKPAREAELIARINALARRTHPDSEKAVLNYGPFEINTQQRTILLHQEQLTLTDKDFDLTLFLFQNQGRLLTREMLLERVWGLARDINTRTVDTHISRLRRRLGLNPENGFRIKTIYQRGYRLEAMKANEASDPMPTLDHA